MSLNQKPSTEPQVIPYMDMGGGLNTAMDPHAIDRNQLTVSINTWPAYGHAISKRPGSIPIGNSGTGKPCISLLACRFNDTTYLLEVKTGGGVFAGLAAPGQGFKKIGNVSPTALFCTSAQLFDPTVGANGTQCVFLCDGLNPPQFWQGPGTMLQTVATGANNLPTKDPKGLFPITPQYVATLGNNSHLFYSGEPSQPSAVYVSDPFFPQQFTSPAMQVNPTQANAAGEYIPAIIGNNDGVDGGAITGLDSLGSAMLVFKEAAVYVMIQTTLLGEIPAWQVVQVSNNRGCLSPRSIASFDTFVTFLSIDGVYATDGNTAWMVSGDVPSFFDSSLTGQEALIANRTNAIAVRQGTRLLLFFIGLNAPITSGVWFDFSKPTVSGSPMCGQIEGMNVGGAAALTGPKDDGNFAWSDAAIDNVAKFGIGYADLDSAGNPAPITVTIAGKADLLDDLFGPEACIGQKQVQTAYALVELLGAAPGTGQSLNFQGAILVDNELMLNQSIAQQVSQGANPTGIWGAGVWNQMTWGGSAFYGFSVVKMPCQNSAKGHLIQFSMTESSIVPWIMIGYVLYANLQFVSY